MSVQPLITTEWVLPSGLRSSDLSPAPVAMFPREVGGDSAVLQPLRDGAFLLDVRNHFRVPVTVGARVGIELPMLALRLPSRGSTLMRRAGLPDMEETEERWNLALTSDVACAVDHRPGLTHRSMSLVMPRDRLRAIVNGHDVPGPVRRFLDGDPAPFGAVVRTSAALRTLASQLRANPYRDGLAALYWEAKIVELLAAAFASLGGQPEAGTMGDFSGRDRRRALLARDMLMANLADPPSMEELARQVGTSQRRLIASFHVVFGVTPLKCLVAWRLERARQLLADGELSVKQVATAMGYAHASSFSQAFTRQFGSPPRRRGGR